MAENLVREEYIVNYQNDENVPENSNVEEQNDQVSKVRQFFGIG